MDFQYSVKNNKGYNIITIMHNYSIVIGLCCYNSGAGLPRIFENLKVLHSMFNKCSIIFCYDVSDDATLELITNFKSNNSNIDIHIIFNSYPKTSMRTTNIANARNTILNFIRIHYSNYDLFSMMDTNEYSCIGNIIESTINDVFNVDIFNKWDAVSFNREAGYYDHWALSISPYVYSFFHFTDWNIAVANLRLYFNNILENTQNQLIYVHSAFNGFSIYKLNNFIDCSYSSNINLDFFDKQEVITQCQNNQCNIINQFTNDCEHRHFHLESICKHNSKIAIYNKSAFKKIYPPILGLRGPA